MIREVSVQFPEVVWTSIVEFEPFPGALALAPTVRQRLRGGRLVRQNSQPPTFFRVVVFTVEEAHTLDMWLAMIVSQANAPRVCVTALELLRQARRLSS